MAPSSPSIPPKPSSGKRNSAFPHLPATATPTLEDVARLFRDGKAKSVIVMAGAGISTAAGIPDFRSPETGLYDNLQKYDLPYPEAIFDIEYLEERPEAFYTLAKELYPGNFNPTTTHYWFKLLQDKGILKGVWTQNIDTLERIAGIEDDLIIEAHGSFADAKCLRCSKEYTKESIRPEIMKGQVVRCKEKSCIGKRDALVKPSIVFFGEGLPDKFFDRLPDFKECDLLLVLGTSLSVGPFNTLLHRVPRNCPRLLINLELVGEAESPFDQGFRFNGSDGGTRDLYWKGESDKGLEELCKLVGQGWEDELKTLKRTGWEKLEKENSLNGIEKQGAAEEKSEEIAEEIGQVTQEAEEVWEDEEDVNELTEGVKGVKIEGAGSLNEDIKSDGGVDGNNSKPSL